MASKPKFLKNLLTTASAVGILAVGASQALADDNITIANPAVTSTGAGIRHAAATPRPGTLNANDVLYITNPAHVVQMKGPAGIILDLYGNDGTLQFGGLTNTFTLRNTIDAAAQANVLAANGGGGIAVGGQGANARASVVLVANADYKLNQDSTDLVKSIDLATKALTITNDSDGVNFTSKFTSTGGGASQIIVDANSVTFSDAQGKAGAGFDATAGARFRI